MITGLLAAATVKSQATVCVVFTKIYIDCLEAIETVCFVKVDATNAEPAGSWFS